MTSIDFYVNVSDKLQYSCLLLCSTYRIGTPAVVTAEPELLHQLDKLLWSFSSVEFLPHSHKDSPSTTITASPILLAEQLDTCPSGGLLINLGQQVPRGFERFERFIEVASSLEADRLAARNRWKHYRDRGYELKSLELLTTAEAT